MIREIISRKEAMARGLVRYFTGKPCKYGHISERFLSRKCRECCRIASSKWGADNPEKVREARRRRNEAGYHRDWRAARPDYHIKRSYGITSQEWYAMFDQQGRACAICRTTEPGKQKWNTDHCHDTGIVRGILCNKCNQGLGLFKDRVVNLSSAITYLERTGRSQRDTVRTRPFIWDILASKMKDAA
jgi:Autographiviridae endonuclease VII